MSAPAWLDRVLGDRAFVDLGTVAGRAAMAESIIAAIPKRALAAAIATSVRAVLVQKFEGKVKDEHDDLVSVVVQHAVSQMWADLARELGSNAAQSVLCALEEP